MKKIPMLGPATVVHIGLILATGIVFVITRPSPLLASLGFESANLFNTLLGPFFCLAAALQRKPKAKIFQTIFFTEFLWLCAHLLFYGGLLWANGFLQQSCSEGRGLFPFLVIAVPPLMLNVALGSLIASLFCRTWLKVICVVLGYCFYYAWIAACFWLEPSFRLTSHLSIIITSDLLQGDTLSSAVIVFRQATLLMALAIIAFGISFLSMPEPKVFLQRSKKPGINAVLIALIVLSAMCLHYTSVVDLGKSISQLSKDYSALASQNGMSVFADAHKVSEQQAQAILAEALLYQERLAKKLGGVSQEPIIIWLHATNEDKYLYTGAKNVHFALPRHRQIHISGSEIPHPVLGHELAHIYIGEHTDNWLGLPASNILIGNFAISEGLAMFLTPELTITDDMSLMEQASALYHADIRMSMKSLFANNINFALLNPRAAYIYAGAFLQFLFSDPAMGPLKIRTLIQSGSLEQLISDPLLLIKKYDEFDAILAKPIPRFQTLWAQRTFKAKSILLSSCPISLADLAARQQPLVLNKDVSALKTLLKSLPPIDMEEMVDVTINAFMSEGDFDQAYDLIVWLQDQVPSVKTRSPDLSIKELQCLVNIGEYQKALSTAQQINDSALDNAKKRFLLTSTTFLQSIRANNEAQELSAEAIRYLMMASHQAYKPLDFAYALGRYTSTVPSEETVLADYLFARLLMRQGQHQPALTLLKKIGQSQPELPAIIKREALFMEAQAEVALNHLDDATKHYQDLLLESKTARDHIFIEDQLGRLHYKITHLHTR